MLKLESFIEHTLLKPDTTSKQIEKLCRDAISYNFKAVCINPCHLDLAVGILKNSGIKVCTVCGFPLGASQTVTKVREAEACENSGADEIDMVANIGAIKENNLALLQEDIAGVRRALTGSTILKVILECSLLNSTEIQTAAATAAGCGVDYVKTSTGFFGNATLEQVTLLYDTVGKKVNIKAAGGIRDVKTVLAMIEAGASRIGTSSGIEIIEEYRNR